MLDGLPILAAAVVPAAALFLGRLDVLTGPGALWAAMIIAVAQLVGLGVYVGGVASEESTTRWVYAGATAMFGLVVVAIKIVLNH